MELLEIPDEYMLPKIVKPWDMMKWQKNWVYHLESDCRTGAGDTMQSNIACGIMEPNMASDVAGTCAMFTVTTDGINEN